MIIFTVARSILLGKGQKAYDKLVKVRHDAEDPKDALENTSFTSQGTVADGGSLNIVPDFTGYHLVALKELKPTNKDRLYAWKVRNKLRIIHECSPFFLENKTSPTRHKPNYIVQRNIWDQDLEDLLTEAAEDLMFYCCVYLAKDLSAKSVVVMVASGFHWRWVQFSRDEIPEMEFDVSVEELRKRNPAWKVKAVFDAAVRKLANAKIFVLGTEASDRELTAMRDATISIVNNHVAYGPTMLATQPKAKRRKKAVVGQAIDEGNTSEVEQYKPGDENETEAEETWWEDSGDEDGDEGGDEGAALFKLNVGE